MPKPQVEITRNGRGTDAPRRTVGGLGHDLTRGSAREPSDRRHRGASNLGRLAAVVYDAVTGSAPGSKVLTLADGGVAVVDGSYPRGIHLASPGVDYQVEVYDPSPANARRLVAAGTTVPVS